MLKFEHFPTSSSLIIISVVFCLLILFCVYSKKYHLIKNLFIKFIIFILLLFVSWDPYLETTETSSDYIVLEDISESVLEDYRNHLKEKIPTGYKKVTFAEQVGEHQSINRSLTNLELALAEARNYKNVILISDGFQTIGNYQFSLKSLKNTSIFPLVSNKILNINTPAEISEVYAPIKLEGLKTIPVRTIIKAFNSNQYNLKTYLNQKLIKNDEFFAKEFEQILFENNLDLIKGGMHEIKTELYLKQQLIDSQFNYVNVAPEINALLLCGEEADARLLKQILTKQQVKFDLKIGKLGQLENALDQYKFIVLCNTAKDNLSDHHLKQIKSYAQNGGGVLMSGGNQSFGLGNYKDTPIAEILPVQIIDPRKIEKRLNVAVELVLDKSGSMKESQKLEYTKLAAKELVKSLKNDDYIGVVAFDEIPFLAFKQELLATGRQAVNDRIDIIFPGRSTRLLPSLDIAQKQLQNVRAGRKHMIILTDGELPDASAMENYYLDIVKDLNASGTTVSTFVIGGDTSELLSKMAEHGGGQFYRAQDPRILPRLFIEDLKVNIADQTQKENQLFDVKVENLKSIRKLTLNPILGYVSTLPKVSADLELSNKDDSGINPILASWKYGTGKVIAFTSDLSGRWTKPWVNDNSLEIVITDIIDSLRGNLPENKQRTDFDFTYSTDSGTLTLKIALKANDLINNFEAYLLDSQNKKINLNLINSAKGLYETSMSLPPAGNYTFYAKNKVAELLPIQFSIKPSSPELAKGINYEALTTIAVNSGGKIIEDLNELRVKQKPLIVKHYFSHYLMLLALILVLIELIIRERFQ